MTTQQTSKVYKALQALGILILGGVVACTGGKSETSALLFLLGLLLYIGGRFFGWWNHG